MIRPQQFRDLVAGVCAPVTIVTTLEEGRPFGATVSAFASLSLDPPMVTVALDRGSSLLARILRVGRFGVNVLGDGQDDLAVLFTRRGTDRFGAVPWCTDHGLPRLLETKRRNDPAGLLNPGKVGVERRRELPLSRRESTLGLGTSRRPLSDLDGLSTRAPAPGQSLKE